MIVAKNLSYTYILPNKTGKKAVDKVSFELKAGETLGIVGKSGSGKSTLVSMLNGLLVPNEDEGEVLLGGKNIYKDFKNTRDVHFKIGLVFQHSEHQLFENTVFDDIAFGPRNKGFSELEVKKIVNETADLFGINKEILKKSPFSLSGGEKRKCAIAGVCAMKPDVLILDEPTANLDFESKKALFKSLKAYLSSDKSKKSIIFISHVIEEVIEISDKILVLEDGKSVFCGKPEEIFSGKVNPEKWGLKIPKITKIMEIVKNSGYDINSNILTINQAKEEILKLLNSAVVIN